MPPNPYANFFITVSIQILLSFFIIHSRRTFTFRKPAEAVRDSIPYLIFPLNLYNIMFDLNRFIFHESAWPLVILLTIGIAIGCLALGFVFDLMLGKL
jgi:hypothetical protein